MLLQNRMMAHAEFSSIDVYRMKAAFIYNFTKFIAWPVHASAHDPGQLTLCIPPQALVREAFASIEGKNVQEKRLVLKPLTSADDAHACHILFIHVVRAEEIVQVISPIQNMPIVIIGEQENIRPYGGMIHFLVIEDEIWFMINAEAVKQAGLTMSSTLLQLAYRPQP